MTCNAHYVANEGEGRPFCRVAMNQAATIEAAQIENHVTGSQQTAGLGCIGASSPGLRHLLPCLTQPGSTNTLGGRVGKTVGGQAASAISAERVGKSNDGYQR